MDTLWCSGCKKMVLVELFSNAKNVRGKQEYCKTCSMVYNKNYREKNKEKIKLKNYIWRENNPEKQKQYHSSYRKRRPETQRAHWMVKEALEYGRLKKTQCVICGSQKTEAHHPDYSKPLSVVWMCKKCHTNEHQRRYEKERDRYFNKNGITVFHYTGSEFYKQPFEKVSECIEFVIGYELQEVVEYKNGK